MIQKNLKDNILFSLHLESIESSKQKMCLPHNAPCVIGGMVKNFGDPMQASRDIRNAKYILLVFINL